MDQLPHVSEAQLLVSLIRNLESYKRPAGPARVDYGEETLSDQREQFPFTVNRNAIVEGILSSLGKREAMIFFQNYRGNSGVKDRELSELINSCLLNDVSQRSMTSIPEQVLATAL